MFLQYGYCSAFQLFCLQICQKGSDVTLFVLVAFPSREFKAQRNRFSGQNNGLKRIIILTVKHAQCETSSPSYSSEISDLTSQNLPMYTNAWIPLVPFSTEHEK